MHPTHSCLFSCYRSLYIAPSSGWAVPPSAFSGPFLSRPATIILVQDLNNRMASLLPPDTPCSTLPPLKEDVSSFPEHAVRMGAALPCISALGPCSNPMNLVLLSFPFYTEGIKAEVKLLAHAHTSSAQRWCSLNNAFQIPGKPEARQKTSEPCKVNDNTGQGSDVTVAFLESCDLCIATEHTWSALSSTKQIIIRRLVCECEYLPPI